ncbi:MAG: CoA transferase, partial [Sphingobium sp.]
MPSEMDGADLMLERAAINDFAVPGRSSTGGACRLLSARDGGWVALNLARADDRDMLPALFEDGALDPQDDDAIAAHVAVCDAAVLIQRGREFG